MNTTTITWRRQRVTAVYYWVVLEVLDTIQPTMQRIMRMPQRPTRTGRRRHRRNPLSTLLRHLLIPMVHMHPYLVSIGLEVKIHCCQILTHFAFNHSGKYLLHWEKSFFESKKHFYELKKVLLIKWNLLWLEEINFFTLKEFFINQRNFLWFKGIFSLTVYKKKKNFFITVYQRNVSLIQRNFSLGIDLQSLYIKKGK